MPRPLWNGSIGFGLAQIPVRLQTALVPGELELGLLHASDLAPIKYSRICSREGTEVANEDIVKGYEYKKGKYVVLDQEDLEKIDKYGGKRIEIKGFLDLHEVDPLYFERPYYH